LGVRPGPIFRRLLQSVRAARLDGRCATPAEEEALALALIAEEKEGVNSQQSTVAKPISNLQ
jgi:hypothetical protein